MADADLIAIPMNEALATTPVGRDRGSDAEPRPGNVAAAALLAYLAAAPLVLSALAIVAWPDDYGSVAAEFMGLYGAAMIAFFGGVRWGVAVMKPAGPTMRSLVGAGAPLALSLPLFMPWPMAERFVAIMLLMVVLLLDDLSATRRGSGAPAWYLSVRVPLTVLIEIAFLVALAAGVGV